MFWINWTHFCIAKRYDTFLKCKNNFYFWSWLSERFCHLVGKNSDEQRKTPDCPETSQIFRISSLCRFCVQRERSSECKLKLSFGSPQIPSTLQSDHTGFCPQLAYIFLNMIFLKVTAFKYLQIVLTMWS